MARSIVSGSVSSDFFGRRRVRQMRRKLAAIFAALDDLGYRRTYHPRLGGPVFVTLTYRDDVEWSPRHISVYLNSLFRSLGQRYPYVWVTELTKRGRVHYHLIIWLPPGVRVPKPDQSYWPHGFSNISGVRRSAYAYLLKYLSKSVCPSLDVAYPPRCRLFGYAFGRSRDAIRRLICYTFLPYSVLTDVLRRGLIVADVDLSSRVVFFEGGGHAVWRGYVDFPTALYQVCIDYFFI